MRGLGVVVAIVVSAGTAHAGAWYYKWSCSGRCAENQLAITGVSPGYASKEQCEDVRWSDPRREEFIGPGNLGGLTSCEEYESAPSPDAVDSSGRPGPRVPPQRWNLGFLAGPGWRVKDATTVSEGGQTYGLDAGLVAGGRPWFGIEAGLGLQRTSVTAPHYGTAAKSMLFVPFTIGFTSSPPILRRRHVEVRLDLGADLGFLFRVGCSDCDADALSTVAFVGQLRAGLDWYFGGVKSTGVGIDGVLMLGKEGDLNDSFTPSMVEVLPPKFLVRVALLRRNTNLWW